MLPAQAHMSPANSSRIFLFTAGLNLPLFLPDATVIPFTLFHSPISSPGWEHHTPLLLSKYNIMLDALPLLESKKVSFFGRHGHPFAINSQSVCMVFHLELF
jgi:hypothetical protein